ITYREHIDKAIVPMVMATYSCECDGKNNFNVDDALKTLKGEHSTDVQDNHIEDLKTIISELKNTNLSFTRSIIIFNQSNNDERIWIRLERYDNVKSENLFDMFIRYDPELNSLESLKTLAGKNEKSYISSKKNDVI